MESIAPNKPTEAPAYATTPENIERMYLAYLRGSRATHATSFAAWFMEQTVKANEAALDGLPFNVVFDFIGSLEPAAIAHLMKGGVR